MSHVTEDGVAGRNPKQALVEVSTVRSPLDRKIRRALRSLEKEMGDADEKGLAIEVFIRTVPKESSIEEMDATRWRNL